MTGAIIRPIWLRVTHWINAASVWAMVLSGWQIYDAAPIFSGVRFPASITLGGWLGGALLWHFAVMWILVVNYLVYLGLNFCSGRFRRDLLSVHFAALVSDFAAALRGRLKHEDLAHYNAVQKAAYVFAIADIALLVLSGLALWKSVQFPFLREAMGGYDAARIVHFFAMSAIVLFFAVHIAMVALVPRSLLTMLRGR